MVQFRDDLKNLLLSLLAGHSPSPQVELLPLSEHATSLAEEMILKGNRRFAERRWTDVIGKYEEAIHAQPKIAEAHYNLGPTLFLPERTRFNIWSSLHFIEAANLAPGHPVIWNASSFRKYGRVEPPALEQALMGTWGINIKIKRG
jgi:hypothetical protein